THRALETPSKLCADSNGFPNWAFAYGLGWCQKVGVITSNKEQWLHPVHRRQWQ
ncbi:hypothetical protein QQF64_008098, partial [Cirrhinus molitorella]